MLLPIHLTKYVAIRSPNPVLTNPRAKKKEITINQITSLVKALKAAENVKVLVTTVTVKPRIAQAPTGKGFKTRPVIVDKKMASNCHAFVETPAGFGTAKRTMMPIATEIRNGIGLAPCLGGGFGGDS